MHAPVVTGSKRRKLSDTMPKIHLMTGNVQALPWYTRDYDTTSVHTGETIVALCSNEPEQWDDEIKETLLMNSTSVAEVRRKARAWTRKEEALVQ